jgi:hypothetical protein
VNANYNGGWGGRVKVENDGGPLPPDYLLPPTLHGG